MPRITEESFLIFRLILCIKSNSETLPEGIGDILGKRRLNQPFFSDKGANKLMGSDIKGGIIYLDFGMGDLLRLKTADFFGLSMFNRYAFTGF